MARLTSSPRPTPSAYAPSPQRPRPAQAYGLGGAVAACGSNAGKRDDCREDCGLYGGFVGSPDHRTRYLSAIPRFLRWDPVNYWQVWLIGALPLFLIWFIGWAIFGKSLLGLVLGSFSALVTGAAQSYRLSLRRDAATTAERASPHHESPPGP